ncbi:MAG: hypothetical protein UHZ06_06485 [Paludibacteraceae bacterium]|nr:hypothetical protein [Paludibacteraceae bacterium]
MSKIKPLDISTPPNSLFEGISTNYQNNLTYAEFLLGVLKKLNEMVGTLNEHSDFIDNYAGQIEEMQQELVEFRQEWAQFEIDINKSIADQIIAFKAEVYGELSAQLTHMRSYIDVQDQALHDYIDQVALGQIEVYNPATGQLQDLQTVINSLFDSGRENALTATEYDGLELTATYYDDQNISAYDYDTAGKTLLVG